MDLTSFLAGEFPLKQLKRLHHDLTELENYLQLSTGNYVEVKDDIADIYVVQEIIEDLVNEQKRLEREEEKMLEINNLDLDF